MSKLDELSPLRYPGSKRKFTPQLINILSYNCYNPDVIIEPFVGGGSVFLYLLSHGICKYAIISDKDEFIYSFWKVLFNYSNYLIDYIKNVKVDLDNFYFYKNVLLNSKKYGLKKKAEACIFLNRTSFSGIVTPTSGPIGGKQQKSKYKIDCRFNRQSIIDKIEYISTFKNKIKIYNMDWENAFKESKILLENLYKKKIKPLYYLDPPFYNKADKLYRVYFEKNDHNSLKNYLNKLNSKWILSYDYAKEIILLYKNHLSDSISIKMPYTVNSNGQRENKELIISNFNLPNGNSK